MTGRWTPYLVSLLVTSVLALLAALALFPSVSEAKRNAAKRPAIYISRCEEDAVAPRAFAVVCVAPGGLLGTTFPSFAEGLVYRHYGSPVALGTGTIRACLLGPVGNLRLCPEGLLPPSEEAETSSGHLLPATFRFFDVVRCTHVSGNFSSRRSRVFNLWHIFYGEYSYRFSGRPWVTLSIAPRNEVETSIQPTCRHVTLPRR